MSMFSLQRAYHYQQYQCYHSNFCSNWPVIQCLQSSMLQTDHRLHFFKPKVWSIWLFLLLSCWEGAGGRGAQQLQMTLQICSRQLHACFVTLTRNKLHLSQEIKHLLSTLVYAQCKSKTVIITMKFLKGLPMLHFQICQHFATKQITSSMAWTTKHEDSSQRKSIN